MGIGLPLKMTTISFFCMISVCNFVWGLGSVCLAGGFSAADGGVGECKTNSRSCKTSRFIQGLDNMFLFEMSLILVQHSGQQCGWNLASSKMWYHIRLTSEPERMPLLWLWYIFPCSDRCTKTQSLMISSWRKLVTMPSLWGLRFGKVQTGVCDACRIHIMA